MKEKGDFTADFRLVWLSTLAIPVGALCAVVAFVLQRLIAFFTNLFYLYHFHHLGFPTSLIDPPTQWSGWEIVPMILVPVLGGLIVGLMARYGSERIRGHGIPEAMEAILISHSRMLPRVAVLKPLSSAISIGSGGPFGAEGPIIMTGGAFGSIIAQAFRMTAAERKALLVAGAAGGMAATFGTPIAAVLLAVELLLFEWKPRSLVPVAVASAVAVVVRQFFQGYPILSLGTDPLFPMHTLTSTPGFTTLLACVPVGLLAGALSLALTWAVYAAEDAFLHVPIHWMWWPAIGGLAIGIGGCIEPHALGVGYDNIRNFLHGNYTLSFIIGLILVKGAIWAIALGSGTSGGVLAPLLIMGGALGGWLHWQGLPGGDASFWPLIGMAAVMGGTMRSPLTGVLFAVELTGNVYALLPLLIASVVAHGFTVLVMKRSILTEKVARRGYHVSREYSVDPLERLNVSDIMSAEPVTIPASLPLHEVVARYFSPNGSGSHQGYPVVDKEGNLLGLITRTNLMEEWTFSEPGEPPVPIIAYDLIGREPVVTYAEESCRTAAERMAQAGVGRLPVVSPEDPKKVVGIITRSDLLKPRFRYLEEESKRERLLSPRWFTMLRRRSQP
jgi:chloride channel protein, CIC family